MLSLLVNTMSRNSDLKCSLIVRVNPKGRLIGVIAKARFIVLHGPVLGRHRYPGGSEPIVEVKESLELSMGGTCDERTRLIMAR